MQRVRTSALVLVLVLAVAGIAASSASASSFLTHPTGPLIGEATNAHIFTFNAGTLECKHALILGQAHVLKSLHQLLEFLYTVCTAFGFPADFDTVVAYLFNADLKVSIQNNVLVEVLAGALSCHISIGPVGNQNLNSVHYGNQAPKLKINALVRGITYTTNGGACGAGGTNGTWTGEALVERLEAGGVVRWDKE